MAHFKWSPLGIGIESEYTISNAPDLHQHHAEPRAPGAATRAAISG